MASSINNNVNLGGTQEIAGIKRFLQTIWGKSDIPYTSAPANTTYDGLAIQDSNKNTWSSFEGVQYSSGTNAAQMTVRGNSGTLSRMYVQEDNSGNVTYNYGQKTGSNWIKLPWGSNTALLICWGENNGSSSVSITFQQPYKVRPTVVCTSAGTASGVSQNVVSNESTTGFTQLATGGAAGQNFNWLAIGQSGL